MITLGLCERREDKGPEPPPWGSRRLYGTVTAACASLLALAIAYYIHVFSLISIQSQKVFATSAYDVGLFDQGIWLMSRFQAPFTTIKGVNIFGDHVALSSLLLAPVFWLWPSINVLYVFQSLMLGLTAVPVFLFAREKLGNPVAALGIGLSFLLCPALQNMNLENFHPESVVVFPLMFALYFMMTERFRLYYPFLALSVLGKEDIGLTVVVVGVYLLVARRQFRHGLITVGIGAAWYLAASRLIMPTLNGVGILSSQPAAYSYWFQDVTKNLFNLEFMRARLWHPASVAYYKDLLGPLLFLPLLSPATLLMGAPAVALNALSGSDYLRSINYHYNYIGIPIIYAAAINAIAWLRRIKTRQAWAVQLAITAICGALVCHGYRQQEKLSHFPLSGQKAKIVENRRALESSKKLAALNAAVSLVPDGASVSATHALVPHLTHRAKIYMYPNPFRACLWNMWFKEGKDLPPDGDAIDYIVTDGDGGAGEDGLILAYLRESPRYERLFSEQGVSVLKRTGYRPPPGQGANYVSYEPAGDIALTDDWAAKLKVADKGVFAMLYFPSSLYYFRNVLGEEIAGAKEAVEIFGYLIVPLEGRYQFNLGSDGQTLLELDGKRQDGSPIQLTQGEHLYKIRFLKGGGSYGLKLTVSDPSGRTRFLRDNDLQLQYDAERFSGILADYEHKRRQREEFLRNSPNRIVNGSFEDVYDGRPRDWRMEYWQAPGGCFIYAADEVVRKEGRYAGRIEHKEGLADSRWVQEVEVKPKTEYTLSGWIKTADIPRDGVGAFLQVENTGFRTEALFGTTDWRYVEVTSRTDADQCRLKVQCRLGNYGAPNAGRAWFDDVRLVETPQTVSGCD